MRSSKEVIDLILKLADEKKISMSRLAEKAGVAKSSLSRYKSGERDFPINDVGKYAGILNVSIEHLLGLGKENNVVPLHDYNYFPASIPAGLPFEVDGVTQAEKISIPDALMGRWAGNLDIFIAKIFGDSMDKVMPDGSLIAIKPTELDGLKDGDIVVFSNGHEYSVKHYHKQSDKIIFKPNSHNGDHHEQHYSADDNIIIHGKVVMWTVTAD